VSGRSSPRLAALTLLDVSREYASTRLLDMAKLVALSPAKHFHRGLLAPCLLSLASCATAPQAGGPDLELPSYEAVARRHNERIERIHSVGARGTIGLRWTDEDGSHTEQGNLDLWLTMPDRTALNVDVMGERIMWLGSDASRAWLFSFRGGETALRVVPADASMMAGDHGLPVNPGAIFALCGLTPLPAAGSEPVLDAGRDALKVSGEVGAAPVLLYLDRVSLLPVRVEILARDGNVVTYSTIKLDRYERVRLAGRSVLAGELFPTHVDMYADELQVKISVYSPDDDVRDWYFDIEQLTEKFSPTRVESLAPLGRSRARGQRGSRQSAAAD
jgi:hypothetical protein